MDGTVKLPDPPELVWAGELVTRVGLVTCADAVG